MKILEKNLIFTINNKVKSVINTENICKKSRKKINKEIDIMPLVNQTNGLILSLGKISRSFQGISTDALKECQKLAFNLRSCIDKKIIYGYKTPKEYKKLLKIKNEEKMYACILFKNVA